MAKSIIEKKLAKKRAGELLGLFPQSPFSSPCVETSPTAPLSLYEAIELMTSDAGCLSGLLTGESIAPTHILTMSDCLQMVGPCTLPIPTDMVNLHALGHGSNQNFVHDSMGTCHSFSRRTIEPGIPRLGLSPIPPPTTIRVYDGVLKESFPVGISHMPSIREYFGISLVHGVRA